MYSLIILGIVLLCLTFAPLRHRIFSLLDGFPGLRALQNRRPNRSSTTPASERALGPSSRNKCQPEAVQNASTTKKRASLGVKMAPKKRRPLQYETFMLKPPEQRPRRKIPRRGQYVQGQELEAAISKLSFKEKHFLSLPPEVRTGVYKSLEPPKTTDQPCSILRNPLKDFCRQIAQAFRELRNDMGEDKFILVGLWYTLRFKIWGGDLDSVVIEMEEKVWCHLERVELTEFSTTFTTRNTEQKTKEALADPDLAHIAALKNLKHIRMNIGDAQGVLEAANPTGLTTTHPPHGLPGLVPWFQKISQKHKGYVRLLHLVLEALPKEDIRLIIPKDCELVVTSELGVRFQALPWLRSVRLEGKPRVSSDLWIYEVGNGPAAGNLSDPEWSVAKLQDAPWLYR